MVDSLRDQLLGLGFKPAPKPEKPRADRAPQRAGKPAGKHAAGKPGTGKPGTGKPRGKVSGEFDLGKAYALRAQQEKDERIATEREKQEQARLRREARARLAELLQGKALNDAAADIARHFEYGGKIKRIHVNAEQLKALNAGALGVVQQDGRYLLVDVETLAAAEAAFAPSVALRIDPDAPAQDDPYADPKFKVPDDLIW